MGTDFRTARRAKVLSVDPAGLTREEIDGRDRAAVFGHLRSFDHRGLDAAVCAARTLDLLSWPSAGATLAAYRAAAAARLTDTDAPDEPLPPPAVALPLANDALAWRFTCDGETHQLGPDLDWDANPGSPHWAHSLNRFHVLGALLAAHAATGDTRYPRQALTLILHWLDHTDIADAFIPGPDPNDWHRAIVSRYVWISHLEPAIHLVEWGRALAYLLVHTPALIDAPTLLRVLKSVHDQLVWLELVIPEGGHGNGLLTGHGCQLAALTWFPGLRAAPALAAVATARIAATLDRQVLPDGFQHELSTHYHFCTTCDLLHTLHAADRLGVTAPPALAARARQMLHVVRQTLSPDGLQVPFGDGDAELGAWVRETLARPFARRLAGPAADAELASERFPWAGYAVLRQGSRHGRDELFLAFDGGPFGNCHQHEDALTIWLAAYGRALLIDPGRHRYDPTSYYPYLCSTRAHSTVRIDDGDQQARAYPERWVPRRPVPGAWHVAADGRATVSASYDLGYGPERVAVTHRRTLTFHPDPGYWVLTDAFAGAGTHLIESRFQFAPGELRLAPEVVHTTYPDANLALFLPPGAWDGMRVECGGESPRGGWYAPAHNVIMPAPALVLRACRALPWQVTLILHPYRGGVLPTRP